MTDYSRRSMPIGEAMFIQRSVRTFKPDPIPKENLSLIVEAAVKGPNSGNRQAGCSSARGGEHRRLETTGEPPEMFVPQGAISSAPQA